MAVSTNVFSLDDPTRVQIESKFEIKRKLAFAREDDLFGVFQEELSAEEMWALKFLYAYMPLNDLADYDGPLFLRHVRRTLEIRTLLPWGRRVPDHLFLHFVLPYRVNNENVEDCRGILYQELAERVKHLTMEDAILETNHWCHEKATYVGNDPRTVSPMTLIRTALGRCGEQSTLAVAALRSVCIPARQCYTPRWAHSDSNHAWVEAWADGRWHYIGACEPEPRLNQGWFSGPARRAMLVNTRVPSNYPGPEDITLAHEWFTEINLLDGYAPARTIKVCVNDHVGDPIQGASVLLQVYNYAEFTAIAKLTTNEQGEVSLKTGYGELFVHASLGARWGEKKIRVSDGDLCHIELDRLEQEDGSSDMDMVPPPELPDDTAMSIPEEERQRHNERVQAGARIRKDFEETFVGKEQAFELAGELALPSERVWDVLRKARGNSHEIAAFLREQTGELGEWPLRLLESLNDKDLTDTLRTVLTDHLIGALPYRDQFDEETFVTYILCPRVLYEMISPYKRAFQGSFSIEQTERYRSNPAEWVQYLSAAFEVVEDMTYYQGSATPLGSFRLRKGDSTSRDILFVAGCRSIGIPARLQPILRKPQYRAEGVWIDAEFEPASGAKAQAATGGRVMLLRDPEAQIDTPVAAYFINFSFARLENGVYRTLFYPHGKSDVYEEAFELESGSYRMTAGTRLKDGSVLVRLTRFTVRSGQQLQLPLTFRQQPSDVPVLGKMDRSLAFALADGTGGTLGKLAGLQSAVLAWIEPDREPSKHLIREIGELASSYAQHATSVILAVGNEGWTASFDPSSYPLLPEGTVFVHDVSQAVMRQAASLIDLNGGGLPLVLVLDEAGCIRYFSSGYKLGIGREVLQTLARLAE
ncbi:transglutaminase domain-containing protein [Cohnella sp.]|uniref:transglutaminase domain-containing protein n=1 Tax=Cohnella sp. TaxID=1883426 RepID=UPI0035686CB8